MTASASEVPGVSLRPLANDDLPALFLVYASTREEELAAVPWSLEQKSAFLSQQFWAQHHWWQEHYAAASFQVIAAGSDVVGRLYVLRTADEIRIVDIALLPQWRNRGIGGRLLADILAESDERWVAVTIHVEKNNPARQLYRRLGFEVVADRGVYDFWSRPPGAMPPAARRAGEGGADRMI